MCENKQKTIQVKVTSFNIIVQFEKRLYRAYHEDMTFVNVISMYKLSNRHRDQIPRTWSSLQYDNMCNSDNNIHVYTIR